MDSAQLISNILNFIQAFFQLIYWYLEAAYRQFIPPPRQSINGETILVTGAAGGIGREICKSLLQSGSHIKLVLWDLHLPSLEKLAGELEEIGSGKGHKIYLFEVDISAKENIEMASKKVMESVGPISIIFNNAGVGFTGNMLLQSEEEIEKTIQVNFTSHIWIIRQFLPDMVLKNHGRIINTCSLLGLKAISKTLPYCASKFAVNGSSESLKMELEEDGLDGIHISIVYPYIVKTAIIKSLEIKESERRSVSPFLEPEDAGRTIVDGMMRGYEYIYLPRMSPLAVFLEYLVPTKARKALHSRFSSVTFYKDEAEQKRLTMSFCDVINERGLNGNAEK